MAKLKWKRTKNGIQFIEKKTLSERLQSVSFMQAALALFILSLLVLAANFAWAILSNGQSGILISWGALLAMALGIGGIGVTLYGHYFVEAESRLPWKTGIYTNGAIVAFLVLIYLIGLFG